MDNQTNQQVVEEVYRLFAEGNLQKVLAYFDKDVVWIRPGGPDIPFAGTFKGFEEVGKMFALQDATIKLKTFLQKKICAYADTVVSLGISAADVISTGKSYTSEWAQAFTLKDGKIIHVQVYMDTETIAEACRN